MANLPASERTNRVTRALDGVRAVLLSTVTIGILVVACFVAIDLREGAHIHPGYGFLRWNLLLAVVPLVLAHALAWTSRRAWSRLAVPVLALAWLLFLPNAPYLISDLVHLDDGASLVNVLTLGLVAVTGLLIGVKSVQIVQRIVERRFGVAWGWRTVQATAVLTTLGIYMGRVLRWNSWNVLSRPHVLLDTVMGSLDEPRRLAFALAATLISALIYYTIYRALAGKPSPAGPAPLRDL
ncbi:MAG: hypothetical protein QOK36_1773 [Gaiellales bacterium]|nr:hypothetical protein [Gaiellales bacterium]